jgi:fatty acid synthase subunit beta
VVILALTFVTIHHVQTLKVMAKPFEATKAYAQECFERTSSPELKKLLAGWDDAAVDEEAVGYVLVVELLAYQFASPVRWIETVDHMISAGIQRFIEIGPYLFPSHPGL